MIDIQSSNSKKQIAINKVGIKSLKHPIKIDLSPEQDQIQHTIANFDMFVYLPKEARGTHMSRFVEILNKQQWVISIPAIQELLSVMANTFITTHAYIDINFPIFINKIAPVSKISSLLDYDVKISAKKRHSDLVIKQSVIVPVTTLCPCSKQISDYGAHNQRSHITISIESTENIKITELILLAEKHASCELYGILKRADEKYVTEYAYNNPQFVEDIVRNIALELNSDQRITKYQIESENFESIHNHSAYALVESPA